MSFTTYAQYEHYEVVETAPGLAIEGLVILGCVPLIIFSTLKYKWAFRGHYDRVTQYLLLAAISTDLVGTIFNVATDGYGLAYITRYRSSIDLNTDMALVFIGTFLTLAERSLLGALLYRVATSLLKTRIRYDDDGTRRHAYWIVSRAGMVIISLLVLLSFTQWIVQVVETYNSDHEKGWTNLVLPSYGLSQAYNILFILLTLLVLIAPGLIFQEMQQSGNRSALTLFMLALLASSFENVCRIVSTSLDIKVFNDPGLIYSAGALGTLNFLISFFDFFALVFLTIMCCTSPFEDKLTNYLDTQARPAMGVHTSWIRRGTEQSYTADVSPITQRGTLVSPQHTASYTRHFSELGYDGATAELGHGNPVAELGKDKSRAELGGDNTVGELDGNTTKDKPYGHGRAS